jgi:hypothetical protein
LGFIESLNGLFQDLKQIIRNLFFQEGRAKFNSMIILFGQMLFGGELMEKILSPATIQIIIKPDR